MTPKLQEIFDSVACGALDKQLHLGETLGEHSWTFSMEDGRLRFEREQGEPLSFPAQVLGTESESSGTWLWAWANERSGLPPALTKVALSLRDWGSREGVAELTEPSVPIEETDGHGLALVASGLLDASFYYRGPYEGGAVFLAVKDPAYGRVTPDPIARVASLLPGMLADAKLPIRDHRRSVSGYLAFHRMAVRVDGPGPEGRMLGELPDGRRIVATFDALGRLAGLDAAGGPGYSR